jgi:thiol-disulfide isomerase/thioredoxin
VWVLLAAVVVALLLGISRTLTNGVFRGTRRLRAGHEGVVSTGSVDATGSDDARGRTETSVLAGTTYDGSRGERATLLQFSSAFCAPCRATRRTLAEVARVVPGVTHVEVDAEHHLSLVRDLGVLRTPTTLVLDADGRELTRATGAPHSDQALAALSAALA